MQTNIIVATNNIGKATEIKQFFGPCFNVLSLSDISVDIDLDAIEDGDSFVDNAIKKAKYIKGCLKESRYEGYYVLADDSGIEIDALDGQPGVDSANFLGRETPYTDRFDHILNKMQGIAVEGRGARFVCVMALVSPCNCTHTFAATLEGHIPEAPQGEGGFGYDPILFIPEHGVTAAMLTIEQKNAISHRGKALTLVLEHLKS